MRKLIFLILLLFNFQLSAQLFSLEKLHFNSYKINSGKLAGLGVSTFGAIADGLHAGYEADDRTSIERILGVSKYSWAGRYSWKKIYVNNDPLQGFKSPYHKWMGAFDLYHTLDDARKSFYLAGSFVIGINGNKINEHKIHYVYDFLFTFVVTSAVKSGSYYLIRNL